MILASPPGQRAELVGSDIAFVVGDFFEAGDLQTLTVFDCGDKIAGLKQALMGARIEPGNAPAQHFHLEPAATQVFPVDIRYFELAAQRRLQLTGNVNHVIIIEIEPRDGIVRLRLAGFFLDADRPALPVKGHDAVALRVLHPVAENESPRGHPARLLEGARESLAIEDVVSQNQADIILPDKRCADDEGLGKAAGVGLFGIGKRQAQLGAVAEKLAIKRQIAGRGNQQDLPDPGQHEDRQGVIDHGLVEDRQKLLGDGGRHRVEPRAGTAGEDDAFHYRILQVYPASTRVFSFSAISRSAAIIMSMSWSKLTFGCQLSSLRARLASPRRTSTSVGRK